jgi:hypothetical protein
VFFTLVFDCARSRNAPRRSGVEGGLGRSLLRWHSPGVGDEIMWNSRKYTAMAVLGAGLAVAAATPSYAGGCGVSGSAPAAYAGVYTYGWPYGVIGDVGCPAYGYVGGGAYGYAGGYAGGGGIGYGAYGYASGYGPYGYTFNTDAGGCGGYGAYGSTPIYGFAGACRARRNHGYGGYVEARGIAPNGSMSRHVISAKQAAYLDR